MDGNKRILKHLRLVALLITAMLGLGLSNHVEADTEKTDVGLVVESVNAFSMDFYRELVGATPSSNIFISPYSIFSALLMTSEGARGQTELEMGTVLRFPASAKENSEEKGVGYWNTLVMHRGMALLNESIIRGIEKFGD